MNYFEEENAKLPEESRVLLTIMGDSAVLDGKFKISQSIDIDCEVRGKLNVDGKLTIQKNGLVSADVKTTDAEIIGTYEGNMEASGVVEIKEIGIAIGNMKTDSLIINKGGIFSGNVTRMSGDEEKSKKRGKASKIKKEYNYSDDTVSSTGNEDLPETSKYQTGDQENEEGLSL
ncbi:MAG: polymer-forming cytoskeletal protein [Actinobacteria bacterium]|nr:polymer-forming cytoskeletal protein [Actinomycetota bacterium]